MPLRQRINKRKTYRRLGKINDHPKIQNKRISTVLQTLQRNQPTEHPRKRFHQIYKEQNETIVLKGEEQAGFWPERSTILLISYSQRDRFFEIA